MQDKENSILEQSSSEVELVEKDVETSIQTKEETMKEEKKHKQSQFRQEMKKYAIKDWKVLFLGSSILFAIVFILFTQEWIAQLVGFSFSTTWTAIMGALLLITCTGNISIEEVIKFVDWQTLLFFTCLFILTRCLELLGMIDAIGSALQVIISSVSSDWKLVISMSVVLWTSSLVCTIFNNIAFIAAMLPLIEKLAVDSKLPFAPLLFSLVFGSCLGGTGTLLGAGCNAIAAAMAKQSGSNISFFRFLKYGIPFTLVATIISNIYVILVYQLFGVR